MADFPIVDAHVHMLPPADGGATPEREPYDIWEYGPKEGVEILDLAGTAEDVAAAMGRAGCDHFVVVNMFVPDYERTHDPEIDAGGLAARMQTFNQWALDEAASRADMTALVAADANVLGGKAGADHLNAAADQGGRGIKIHPVMQQFRPDDPAMDDIYRVCEERDLAVVAHAGASRGAVDWASPHAYAEVMRRFPRLRLVLAHLGGARWGDAAAFAAAFPSVSFDLCEIVAWLGAPAAPTPEEFTALIREIGSGRILFGTDFPWYDVDTTIAQVMDLPGLSIEEKQNILGANAVRVLGLDLTK